MSTKIIKVRQNLFLGVPLKEPEPGVMVKLAEMTFHYIAFTRTKFSQPFLMIEA